MATSVIDHGMLTRLVEAGSIRSTHVVGRHGGWTVVVNYGNSESPLVAQRSHAVRIWRRFETLATYLRDVGILKFDVDATDFDPESPSPNRRPDRSDAMRRAHAAAEHDAWFRAEVEAAVAEADDPATQWVSHDEAVEASARWREKWQRASNGDEG